MNDETEASPRLRGISFAAGWAGMITLICLIVGQGAEQYAKLNETATTPALIAVAKPQFGAIDYSATGAVKGQNGTMSPCGPSK